MHRLKGRTLLCGSLLGLLVGCGEVVPGGSVAGTVTAPASGDVLGTRVIACFDNRPDCRPLDATIEQSGSSAAYRIDNLTDGSYGIYAIKDANGDGAANPGVGDFYGSYRAADGSLGLVTPPASGVDIQMMVLTDPGQQVPEAVRKLGTKTP